MRQHHGRNHLVVSGEFAFRNPVIGKQDLFRMSYHHVSLSVAAIGTTHSGKGIVSSFSMPLIFNPAMAILS
jgi:hypothetical protein